jgi:hypothetical protein
VWGGLWRYKKKDPFFELWFFSSNLKFNLLMILFIDVVYVTKYFRFNMMKKDLAFLWTLVIIKIKEPPSGPLSKINLY